jgi:diguanylate cyclase (GGDEF)-like protein
MIGGDMNARPVRTLTLVPALGVVGAVLGVLGFALDQRVLALLAGVFALAAGVGALRRPAAVTGAPVAHAVVAPPPMAAPAAPTPRVATARPNPATTAATAAASVEATLGEPADGLRNPASGLFNQRYFDVLVETRVSAARRHLRPVSVVLISVGKGIDSSELADPSLATRAIRSTLREADTACHLDDGRFGFVLEDTPEDGAVWTVERLRRAVSDMDASAVQWAGIACYPAHAFNAAEVLNKAEHALRAAREWRQARTEVATAN